MKHGLLLALASTALIACATPAMSDVQNHEPPVPVGDKDTCGAAQYASLVGKPVSTSGVPAPSRMVRHLWPNTIVTMDMAPARLNILISAEGVITGLRCY